MNILLLKTLINCAPSQEEKENCLIIAFENLDQDIVNASILAGDGEDNRYEVMKQEKALFMEGNLAF